MHLRVFFGNITQESVSRVQHPTRRGECSHHLDSLELELELEVALRCYILEGRLKSEMIRRLTAKILIELYFQDHDRDRHRESILALPCVFGVAVHFRDFHNSLFGAALARSAIHGLLRKEVSSEDGPSPNIFRTLQKAVLLRLR